ncbi:hypothetical protein Tco_0219054 [Tanacetum coccineum]
MRVVGEAVKPMSQEDILSFEKAGEVTIATHCLKLTDIKIVRGKSDMQFQANCLPILAVDSVGVHPCDRRRSINEYEYECLFPAVDFSLEKSDEDILWKADILESDVTEEPPSLLDVEVFDFDGPFGQAASLGHTHIRFLRHTSEVLADM